MSDDTVAYAEWSARKRDLVEDVLDDHGIFRDKEEYLKRQKLLDDIMRCF